MERDAQQIILRDSAATRPELEGGATDAMSRRRFLVTAARAGLAGAALASLPSWTRTALAAAAPPADLIERSDWPVQWETRLPSLGRTWITPNERFFVRCHFPTPTIDPAAWRLEVTGLVDRPLSLGLAEVRALPYTATIVTLECAGNGRGLYALPNTSGTQWGQGAVGNAEWGGVRLATLLQRAGVRPEGRHVWFEAADAAPLPAVPRFVRSIPIEKAMSDALLAYTMNSAPLPDVHGAPLRAIVPGWYGMASTKWVTRVRVEAAPSDNHFMAKGYRYVYPGEDPAAAKPVEDMRVKSLITRPADGSRAKTGTLRVEGIAWAGAPGVRIVEVSIDGGKAWRPAGFTGETSPYAWRTWATEVEIPAPRRVTILARATDRAGETQPLEARPNASGYANNSIHRVRVDVRG